MSSGLSPDDLMIGMQDSTGDENSLPAGGLRASQTSAAFRPFAAAAAPAYGTTQNARGDIRGPLSPHGAFNDTGEGPPSAGGIAVTTAAAVPVASLYDAGELRKYEKYDRDIFAALRSSRGCSFTGPVVSLAAKHAAKQSALSAKGIERYLERRAHVYQQVDDLLVAFGGLVDTEEAAAAASAIATAKGAPGASAGGGEEGEAPAVAAGEEEELQQSSNSSNNNNEAQRRAIKWAYKKLRWLCDDELQRHSVLLEGMVALKCCVLGEAMEAVLRQGQVHSRPQTLNPKP